MWAQSIQLPVVASKWGRWAGQTLRTTPYLALKLACEAVSLKNYKYVGNVLRTLCAHSRWWFPWSISAPTENVSLFFCLFCLCNQRQPCLHCHNYSYIYLWLYCMYVPVQVQVQFFCFHEKAKSLEPNAPPVKVACPVHVVCCQACTCKETSCCEVTVLTTATRSATDTVLLVYVISRSGLASYLPYRHKSGAYTAV